MEDTCPRCGAPVVAGRCTRYGTSHVVAAPTRAPEPVRPPIRMPLVVAGVAGLVVLALAGAVLAVMFGNAPTAPVAATVPPAVSPQPAANPAPSPDPEQAARDRLTALAAGGATVPKDGRWVAQLASKYVGITDPRQVTAEGSHTFLAADILAEHEALAALGKARGVQIVLLDSRTYGRRHNQGGDALWVTMALSPSFTGEDAVAAWCRGLYPDRTGEDLRNACLPNRLNP